MRPSWFWSCVALTHSINAWYRRVKLNFNFSHFVISWINTKTLNKYMDSKHIFPCFSSPYPHISFLYVSYCSVKLNFNLSHCVISWINTRTLNKHIVSKHHIYKQTSYLLTPCFWLSLAALLDLLPHSVYMFLLPVDIIHDGSLETRTFSSLSLEIC